MNIFFRLFDMSEGAIKEPIKIEPTAKVDNKWAEEMQQIAKDVKKEEKQEKINRREASKFIRSSEYPIRFRINHSKEPERTIRTFRRNGYQDIVVEKMNVHIIDTHSRKHRIWSIGQTTFRKFVECSRNQPASSMYVVDKTGEGTQTRYNMIAINP